MSKYERRMFFERLVELRTAYGQTDHSPTTMTVSRAIRYAVSLLDHPDKLDALLADDPTTRSESSAA
jgi:hypothetical protein